MQIMLLQLILESNVQCKKSVNVQWQEEMKFLTESAKECAINSDDFFGTLHVFDPCSTSHLSCSYRNDDMKDCVMMKPRILQIVL